MTTLSLSCHQHRQINLSVIQTKRTHAMVIDLCDSDDDEVEFMGIFRSVIDISDDESEPPMSPQPPAKKQKVGTSDTSESGPVVAQMTVAVEQPRNEKRQQDQQQAMEIDTETTPEPKRQIVLTTKMVKAAKITKQDRKYLCTFEARATRRFGTRSQSMTPEEQQAYFVTKPKMDHYEAGQMDDPIFWEEMYDDTPMLGSGNVPKKVRIGSEYQAVIPPFCAQ